MAAMRGGLSQNEAADLAGVSRTLWRQMEDPERAYRSRRRNVVKVARFLGWDLTEALRLAGHSEPPTELELAEMERGPRDDLDRMLRQLTEAQIRALAALVESILNPHALPRAVEDNGAENGSDTGASNSHGVHLQYVDPNTGDVLGPSQQRAHRNSDD